MKIEAIGKLVNFTKSLVPVSSHVQQVVIIFIGNQA